MGETFFRGEGARRADEGLPAGRMRVFGCLKMHVISLPGVSDRIIFISLSGLSLFHPDGDTPQRNCSVSPHW